MSDTGPSQSPWRVVGGPLGTHTSERSRSVAVHASLAVALTAIPMLVAIGLRGWCLRHGFAGQVPLWRACYSDLPAMLQDLQTSGQTADPLVTRTVLRFMAALVPTVGASGQTVFVLLWAAVALVLLAVCAVAIAAYQAWIGGDPDRALLFVLCPALPLGLLISGDLLGVTLMTVGLVTWRMGRDATAGVLLALAAFSRSIALIAVVAIVAREVVPAIRHGSRRRSLRRLAVGFGSGVGAVIVGGLLAGGAVLTGPVRDWWQTTAGYGSVWVLPHVANAAPPAYHGDWLRQLVSAVIPPDGLMPWISLGGWALAIGLVIWLAGHSWGRPTLPDLTVLGVAVVLLTAPALPVQASLWLVPLVALSTLPRRDMLIWAGAEVVYFPMVWVYLGGLENPSRGLPAGWYAVFVLIRLIAIGYLAWRVAENSRFEPPWLRRG